MVDLVTNTTSAWGENVSVTDMIDDMRKMLARMPAIETWCLTDRAPADGAIRITGERENFLIAPPAIWGRLLTTAARASSISPFGGVGVIDIDITDDMSRPARELRAAIWQRIAEAYLATGASIPDWMIPEPFKSSR